MREIKFRAWESIHKRMFKCEIVDAGVGFESWFDHDDGCPSSKILMQYTGLKDKNGVEIWEGDVLKRSWNFKTPHGTHRKGSEIAVAVWSELGEWRYSRSDLWSCIAKSVVIGNIHDNPELLEGANND